MSTAVQMAVTRSLSIASLCKEASLRAIPKRIPSVGVGFIAEGHLKRFSQSHFVREQRLFKVFHGKPYQIGTQLVSSSFRSSFHLNSQAIFSPVSVSMIPSSSVSTSSSAMGNNSPPRDELSKETKTTEKLEEVPESPPPPKEELSTKEKLKQAVRDYGATVIVFHVAMSLTSLGFFYLLVESGLDVISILGKLGISENLLKSKITEEAGKFVVAYAVHKVFAPLRIGITLTATPFIVRKLRGIGILKQIKTKSQ